MAMYEEDVARQFLSTNGFQKNSAEFKLFTPDIAREYLAQYRYIGQRPYAPSHAKYLADEIMHDRFKPTSTIVVSKEPNGEKYLINGQHTLNAIILANKPQTAILVIYGSKDEEDTAATYSVIDTNRPRGVADALAAFQLADSLGFTPTQLNAIGSGVKFIKSKFLSKGNKHSRVNPIDLKKWIEEYSQVAHEYFEIIAGKPKEMGASPTRQSTISVALVTLRFSTRAYGKEKIEDFWRGSIFDDEIPSGDARKVAHRHLITAGITGGAAVNVRYKERFTTGYSSRYLANCFNAFIEGRSITLTKVIDASVPIKIVGSPFSGK